MKPLYTKRKLMERRTQMNSLRGFPNIWTANSSRPFWLTLMFVLLSTSAMPGALAQSKGRSSGSVAPSNKQLASPEIELKVDALLKKMTLDEKLGQLVQYSDSGYSAQAQTADE